MYALWTYTRSHAKQPTSLQARKKMMMFKIASFVTSTPLAMTWFGVQVRVAQSADLLVRKIT